MDCETEHSEISIQFILLKKKTCIWKKHPRGNLCWGGGNYI
jgi:hypothetical protein